MDSKKYLYYCYLIIGIIGFLTLLSTLIVGICLFDYSFLWGFMICIPFNILAIYISYKIPNLAIDLGLKKKTRGFVTIIAIIAYISKYILIIMPLLIGALVNDFVGETFNIYTLVAGVLIYPITFMISRFFCLIIERRKQKGKLKQHA